MIVVDTSALMAILLAEPDADRCSMSLERADVILISAGTVAEALVVARRRNVFDEMERLITGLAMEVIAVDFETARRVEGAFNIWGRGAETAGLNFGDCFAYALAISRNAKLLFVGSDFAKTDVLKT